VDLDDAGRHGADGDDALLARAAAGDTRAVRALADAHLPRLVALGHRMTGDAAMAEDIAQEAMIRLWRQAPRWRPGRARLGTWLYRVATNLAIDRLRRARREVIMASPPEQADSAPDPETRRLAEDAGAATVARVQAALDGLPARQKAALVLVHYEGLDQKSAAEMMGIGLRAFESLLARGRRALRGTLGDLT
jgi:RNA polymerase sigma factor (sigma-70 family)